MIEEMDGSLAENFQNKNFNLQIFMYRDSLHIRIPHRSFDDTLRFKIFFSRRISFRKRGKIEI